jgi:two-component system response regulator AlgR
MSLRVLIVDDEPLARTRLRALLADCREPATVVQGEAGDAAAAQALLRLQSFDVALVDIHLPGDDGLQLAASLRELPQAPLVVFVTAYAEHAVRAFELEALDYLTKPVRLERLRAALQKAERALRARSAQVPEAESAWLLITERGRTLRLPLAEVLYCKAEQKYVTVRTMQTSHLLDDSLNELERRHPARFVRIHRNALVARGAIRTLERQPDGAEGEGWVVRLAGVDECLPVSRRQVAALRELLGA